MGWRAQAERTLIFQSEPQPRVVCRGKPYVNPNKRTLGSYTREGIGQHPEGERSREARCGLEHFCSATTFLSIFLAVPLDLNILCVQKIYVQKNMTYLAFTLCYKDIVRSSDNTGVRVVTIVRAVNTTLRTKETLWKGKTSVCHLLTAVFAASPLPGHSQQGQGDEEKCHRFHGNRNPHQEAQFRLASWTLWTALAGPEQDPWSTPSPVLLISCL